ncbi:MAG: hypothetical protein M1823_003454 [Watsoniomyces obsoletus]|nr:MAG: hypothetical protein M1823_003454 [Watsoniomyces obsoletus]
MARPQPTATPVKTAFAGSSFNASPAPSALPLPKLLSKSVPANAGQRSLQARLQHEQQQQHPRPQDSPLRESSPTRDRPQTDSVTSSPSRGALQTDGIASPTPHYPQPESIAPAQPASPLDIFFRAAQREKIRNRRALDAAAPSPSQRHSFGPGQLPGQGQGHYLNGTTTTPSTPTPPPRHRRQPTDLGGGTIDPFPFDMDRDTPTKKPPDHSSARGIIPPRPPEVGRSHTAPGTMQMQMGQVEEDERLRKQTEILKALLKLGSPPPST